MTSFKKMYNIKGVRLDCIEQWWAN